MTFLITSDLIARFWALVEKRGPDDCWPWKGCCNKGYGMFRVGQKICLAHRYSFLLANGFLPKGRLMVIAHTCENSSCINPKHLECDSQKNNNNYPERLKRASGWKHSSEAKSKIEAASRGNAYAKTLSDDTVIAIYKAPGLHREIARTYGVSQAYVSLVKAGKRSASLTGHAK